jgi:hypothetical protein
MRAQRKLKRLLGAALLSSSVLAVPAFGAGENKNSDGLIGSKAGQSGKVAAGKAAKNEAGGQDAGQERLSKEAFVRYFNTIIFQSEFKDAGGGQSHQEMDRPVAGRDQEFCRSHRAKGRT